MVQLTGDVHYPTLFTYPEDIKNQHIAPMANCSKELIIKNISPLPVAFKYEWEVTSYVIEKLSTPRVSTILIIVIFSDYIIRINIISYLSEK